jgi:type IV pilus assembly protein PilQ
MKGVQSMNKKTVIILFLVLMMPLLCFGQTAKRAVSKVSFDFIDADVRNVLRALTEVSGKNIVIADDVKGKITMKLENVSWDDALDIVVKNNDLAMMEEEGIVRITTLKRYLELKERDKKERQDFLKEKQEKLTQGEELVTETIFLNYTTAADVEKVIKAQPAAAPAPGQQAVARGFLSPYGTVTTVAWSNALIVKDTRDNVTQIKQMIKDHDFAPAQVQIEARIVQANTNFSKELGVQWGAKYRWNSRSLGKEVEVSGAKNYGETSGATAFTSPTGQVGVRGTESFPYNVNLPAAVSAGSGGTFGIFIGSVTDSFALDVQLSALENDGKGKILSNPKVITSNNKAAIIKQGQQIPYQTVSQSGTQTEFKDAVLSLEVTPQVTKDNNIKLKIKATKDRPITIAGSAIPGIDKKESSTEVIVKDGETAVIGGIYEAEESFTEAGVPGLRNIPLLGWLFKKDTRINNKSELLIFITPVIIKNLYKEEG